MNIAEEFTYNDQTYIIYYDVINSSTTITMAKSQCGGIPIGGKTYVQRDDNIIWLSMEGVFVSSEIDNAILTYVQHKGFAGLTPVEYLHNLGLTE